MFKAKEHRNGWCVIRDGNAVIVRTSSGEVHDKVRCDTGRQAGEYWRAFNAIARNA